jgi:membrane protease YdiL (CAAX protease family)
MPESLLRPFWTKIFKFDWKFGTFLLLIICVSRFILVLDANKRGNYDLIGAIMVLSGLAPVIFLNRAGLKITGVGGTREYEWIFLALFTGIAASLVLYFLGYLLYGLSDKNWYVYIARSYKIPSGIIGSQKMVMCIIMAIVGMTFSPIGEELFFRGIVQSSFAASLGEKRALIIDGLAFSLTHISHFGIVYLNGHFTYFTLPGLIWVVSMFLVSLVFYFFKKRCNSLLGAVFCHSGFNLGMICSIFYLL